MRPMQGDYESMLLRCEERWRDDGFVNADSLLELARTMSPTESVDDMRDVLALAFDANDLSLDALRKASGAGDVDALATLRVLDSLLGETPYRRIEAAEYQRLRQILASDPDAVHRGEKLDGYPYHVPGRTYAYDIEWVRSVLARGRRLFAEFKACRSSETAILVGNGPSLKKVDFSLLEGQDVYISNYAIKHERLARLARGVGLTNYLVVEQEPYRFFFDRQIWKFFPFWLRNTLVPDERSIVLNAEGGELFCSPDVLERVSWHSTVSHFWLQILYSAGYRKVLLIGFDHSYTQNSSAAEGDLIVQTDDDPNHFDPTYFRGKKWQAADVGKMGQTYLLSGKMYEEDGREIVNCTIGGSLETFRRSSLKVELAPARSIRRVDARPGEPKVAVITAFWRGDVNEAERHWRLLARLGCPGEDHYHLFKHGPDSLPPVTLPNVLFADIERRYPDLAEHKHPAGPNLVFVHALDLLRDSGYTHFFWLEPDCVPTSSDWLAPFIQCATEFPDEAVVGTGGGTVVPGARHWKHHFAGCSLYNIERLLHVDFQELLNRDLGVSFDVWLSVKLGYIELADVNDEDQTNTIIFGEHRYDWRLRLEPPSLVTTMFEHWRPDKFLTPEQIRERIRSEKFSLYHAIKDETIVREIFAGVAPCASTIVINYNNESFIRAAIESALNQSGLNGARHQVIVVDDGSSDGSQDIIRSFGDRVESVFLEHGGLIANFNQQRALREGLRRAHGDVVFLLDGDDLFGDEKVGIVLKHFDDPDVVLAQHVLNRIDGRGEDLDLPMIVANRSTIDLDTYRKHDRCNFYQPTSGLAVRRCYLTRALGWLSEDQYTNTWLDVRITRPSPFFGTVVNLSETLGSWRRHTRSDSIRKDDLQERLVEHHDWFNQMAAEFGFHLAYEDSEHDVRLKRRKSLLRQPRDAGAHFDETRLISRIMSSRKGASHVMLDVGAHVGSSAAYFDALEWTIHCFEPDPNNRRELETRFAGKDNVRIDSRALSDTAATDVPFFASPESTGVSGLLAFRDSHEQVASVDVSTLSDVIRERQMDHVDFLKIDVEGYDFSVLRGVPWDRLTPDVIECEFEDSKTRHLGHTWKDICEFLVAKGYTLYVSEWHPIIRYGIPHDWHALKRYPCELTSDEGWGNLLAFLKDPGEDAVVGALERIIQFRNRKLAAGIAEPAPGGAVPHAGSSTCDNRGGSVRRPFYASFGDRLRARAPAFYELGRAGLWMARFLKRHSALTALTLVLLVVSLVAPLLVARLFAWAPYLWTFAAVLMLGAAAVVGGAAVHGAQLMLENQDRNLRYRIGAEISRAKNELRADSERKAKVLVANARKALAEEMRSIRRSIDEIRDRNESLGSLVSDLQSVWSTTEEELAGTKALLQEYHDGMARSIGDLEAKTGSLRAQLTTLKQKRPLDFQTFNRIFSQRHLGVIEAKWLQTLGIERSSKSIAYLAHRIVSIERRLNGRLAASVEDAVLRTLVVLAADSDSLEVLEIGTLFGIGIAILHDRARNSFDRVHFTAIDTLEGYYEEGGLDVLTGEKVTSSIVRQNFEEAGIPVDEYTLIKGASSDPAIIRTAGENRYDVVIIDGDHTFDGVKTDFESYAPFVKPGGYIIIDDYASDFWPDVTRFVDDELAHSDEFAIVGTTWHTAVLRKG